MVQQDFTFTISMKTLVKTHLEFGPHGRHEVALVHAALQAARPARQGGRRSRRLSRRARVVLRLPPRRDRSRPLLDGGGDLALLLLLLEAGDPALRGRPAAAVGAAAAAAGEGAQEAAHHRLGGRGRRRGPLGVGRLLPIPVIAVSLRVLPVLRPGEVGNSKSTLA